jgi:hypothetical protein
MDSSPVVAGLISWVSSCYQPVPGYEIQVDSHWVAPFVEFTEIPRMRSARESRVRWYSATNGAFQCESTELRSAESPFGFYFVSGTEDALMFHGMYNTWRVPASRDRSHVMASKNGETFIQVVNEGSIPVAVNVYVTGKLKAAIGPIPGMRVSTQFVSIDGSVAAVLSPYLEQGPARAYVVNPQGKVTLTYEDKNPYRHAFPASNGRGLLLWQYDGNLLYVDEIGRKHFIHLDPELELAAWTPIWVPESSRVLIASEKRHSHVLIDCELERVLWEAPAPLPGYLLDSRWAVPFGDYVFQSGLWPTDDPCLKSREIRALNLQTGKLVARWRSSGVRGVEDWQELGQFMIRDGHLYYLAGDTFGEVRVEDVKNAGKGCCRWEPFPSEN